MKLNRGAVDIFKVILVLVLVLLSFVVLLAILSGAKQGLQKINKTTEELISSEIQ